MDMYIHVYLLLSAQTVKSTSSSSSKSSHPKHVKTAPSSGGDPAPQPTRSSQRNVKRPKTYDEELAELEMAAAKSVKKPKGSAVSGGDWEELDGIGDIHDLISVLYSLLNPLKRKLEELGYVYVLYL